MKKKSVSILLVGVLTMSMLVGCGSAGSSSNESDSSDEEVTISLYTTIPNNDAEFEELCNDFMEENPNITVNYIAYDSSEKQKWLTLYSSGEAPTVSVMDPIDIQENIENLVPYDLDEDTWITDQVDDTYLDVFKSESGEVYGVPNSVQAMGIIYNKTTIEAATGEEFDPSTIQSSEDFLELCEKIEAGGVKATMFTGVDWSLGSHYLSLVFSGIRGDVEEQEEYIDGLIAGTEELNDDDVWNSVMDTFDIIAEYNYNAEDPLVGNTDLDAQALADGEVAMWFMGDWGWSYLEDIVNSEDEYGLMPVPLTASDDDANQELSVFPSKGYCIDGSQNDEAQQEAGKKLVEYLCVERAQDMADILQVALPFSGVDVSYTSPLVTSTQSYISDEATLSTYAYSMLLPSDFWSENGAYMQQYLAGGIDRDALADSIEAYWQSQE